MDHQKERQPVAQVVITLFDDGSCHLHAPPDLALTRALLNRGRDALEDSRPPAEPSPLVIARPDQLPPGPVNRINGRRP